jgi:hypothetical protein
MVDGGTVTGDRRLFPAEIGRSWSYRGTATQNGVTQLINYSYDVPAIMLVAGRNAYVVQADWNGALSSNYTLLSGDDDVLQNYPPDANWYPVLKGPAVEGGSWSYYYGGTRTQTWHAAGRVTVAAGTFDDCWRIDYTIAETSRPGDVNYQVVCRGVGSVKVEERIWATGQSVSYELVHKSF